MSDEQVAAVQRALGLGLAAESGAMVEPGHEAPVESVQPEDTEPEQADDVEPDPVDAHRSAEQERDAVLWAGGVPPALTPDPRREAERAWLEAVHRQPEDAA